MRTRAICLALLVVATGCSRVLGIDFDQYREPEAGSPEQLQCVPQDVSRCLCELDEGVRTCDDAGHLGSCVCARPDAGACGNGVLEDGESCDDSNQQDGDGCSAACIPDGRPPQVEQCPGQSVFVWAGRPVTLQLTGAKRAASNGPDGGACGPSNQPDRVFSIATNATGKLQIVVTASVPTVAALRSTCEASSSLACTYVPASQPTAQVVDVTMGQTVVLTLDPAEVSPNAMFSIEVTHL